MDVSGAVFDIKIVDPHNNIIFKKTLVGDDTSTIQFSLPITNDFEFGRYLIKYSISKEGYETYSEEHKYFFVLRTHDDIVPAANYEFDLWAEQTDVSFQAEPRIFAKFCLKKSPRLDAIGFDDPESKEIVDQPRYLHTITLLKPDGSNKTYSAGWFESEDCNKTIENAFYADMGGTWTIRYSVKWSSNGTLYKAESNPLTIKVKEAFFSSSEISPIQIDSPNVQDPRPLDWSLDGSMILFSDYSEQEGIWSQSLWITDPSGKNTRKLDINNVKSGDIGQAKISPDGRFVHFTAEKGFFRHDLQTSENMPLDDRQIFDFDYYVYGESDKTKYFVVTSADSSIFDTPSKKNYILADNDLETETILENAKTLIQNIGTDYFDLSSDGKKILYKKLIDPARSEFAIAYRSLDGNEYVIPNANPACGSSPKWSPNGELVLYTVYSCSKGPAGGTLRIVTLDGTYGEVIIPYTNVGPDNFVISPDGQYIIYSERNDIDNGFKKLSLSKPIPEFGVIALFVLILPISFIVIIRRLAQHNL